MLVDKQPGRTSNDTLQKVRNLFAINGIKPKAGHGGTLDKAAQGCLAIVLGYYTKLAGYMLGSYKTYEAKVQLGVTTTTLDAEGEITATKQVSAISRPEIEACLDKFRGTIMQKPPIYSALKHKGKALYRYAIEDQEVSIAPRQVEIRSLELLNIEEGDVLHLKIESSRGTYIRSLARDIGENLGCGAHLSFLRRSAISVIPSKYLVSLEDLEKNQNRSAYFVPDTELNIFSKTVEVSLAEAQSLKQGKIINKACPDQGKSLVPNANKDDNDEQLVGVYVKIDKELRLFAAALPLEHSRLKPQRIFRNEL